MAIIGTLEHQLVDFITKEVGKAGEATPSPSRTLVPTSGK